MWVRRSPGFALFALAAFVATLGLPFVSASHGFGDDVDYSWGEAGLAGHPVAQVEPVYQATADEHCAICHWARAFGSSTVDFAVRHLPPAAAGTVVSTDSDSCSTLTISPGRPRGPPSNL